VPGRLEDTWLDAIDLRAPGIPIGASLPTPLARDSFQVLDTTSNKFSLGAFDM
jgi:hypothetical protein